MKVIRSKVLGYCSGVSRAVEMARRETVACSNGACPSIYTLGPLIHNPVVLEDLKKRGIRVLEEDEALSAGRCEKGSTVIIRAHGISPQAEKALAGQGLRVVDATCPHVKLSQDKARQFSEKGYRVFLAGEKDHAEIKGILGYISGPGSPPPAGSACYVVGNPAEAESAAESLFEREPGAKTALIGQTTVRAEEYTAIGEAIKRFFPGLEIANTICGSTAARQEALRELCRLCDAVIIVGGRESANTRRLLSLARETGKPAWLVETAGDLPPEIKSFETVGLSAGASAPGSLIDEIETALAKL